MSVHISVIGKIARDAPSMLQVSMTRRNLTLKVTVSSAYEQFSVASELDHREKNSIDSCNIQWIGAVVDVWRNENVGV